MLQCHIAVIYAFVERFPVSALALRTVQLVLYVVGSIEGPKSLADDSGTEIAPIAEVDLVGCPESIVSAVHSRLEVILVLPHIVGVNIALLYNIQMAEAGGQGQCG